MCQSKRGEMMGDDISKTTVTILLVLTILVSVVGTWVTLEGLSEPATNVQVSADHASDTGRIRINIKQPEVKTATGTISLKIEGGE